MKCFLGLFLLFYIVFPVSSQQIIKVTAAPGLKLGKIAQLVIKDTVPKKETRKDTLFEKKLEGKPYNLYQFEHESFLFAKSPASWHKADWLRLGLVAATTVAIMPFDLKIANVTQNNQHAYYDLPVEAGRIYGEWYFTASVATVFVGYGVLKHNTKAEKIDVELFQAGLYSEVITQLLKVSIGRANPMANVGEFNFRPFKFQKDFGSMPNGSASLAFAISTITFHYAKSNLVKILAYVPAAFNLFSGVYKNTHWASDEFMGASIGYSIGTWVVTLHEGKRHKINIPEE